MTDRNKALEAARDYEALLQGIMEALAANHDILLIPLESPIDETSDWLEIVSDHRTLIDPSYTKNRTGIWTHRNKGRMEIGAHIAKYKDISAHDHGSDKAPNKITVSMDRDPASIARDIARRYWPDFTIYRDYWHEVADATHRRKTIEREARQRLIERFSARENWNGSIYSGNWEVADPGEEGAYKLTFTRSSHSPLDETLYMLLIDTYETYHAARHLDETFNTSGPHNGRLSNLIWPLVTTIQEINRETRGEIRAALEILSDSYDAKAESTYPKNTI